MSFHSFTVDAQGVTTISDAPEPQSLDKYTLFLNRPDWTSRLVLKTNGKLKIMPARVPLSYPNAPEPPSNIYIYIYIYICTYNMIYATEYWWANRKLPFGRRATVTLGKGLQKDKLAYAVMRMRQLGRGHTV